MVSNLDKAVAEREQNKKTAKWIDTNVVAEMDEVEVDLFLEEVIKLRESIALTQGRIVACVPVDMTPHDEEHEALVTQTMLTLLNLKKQKAAIERVKAAAAVKATPAPPGPGTSEIRLPKLDPPEFDGTLSDWLSFKDQFTAAVHNNKTLSNVSKLTYLHEALQGDAKRVIKSIECTADNYDIAWALLQNRFQNERELFFSILKRFVSQTSMTQESATGLRSVVDVSQECIRALENLKVPVDQWDGILVFLMVQKIDPSSRRYWEMSLKDTSIPKLKEFLEFLEQQARALAAGGLCRPTTKAASDPVKKVSSHLAQSSSPRSGCQICHEDHLHHQCPKLRSMALDERREAVRKSNLCFNCLRKGHSAAKCSSQSSCQTCKSRHHTLLHRTLFLRVPKPWCTTPRIQLKSTKPCSLLL
jgi:hypothetical protein